jgi:hypothetical protein
VVQGGTAIFRLRKQLENVEKRKLDFLFSRSEKSRMDLFRASLGISATGKRTVIPVFAALLKTGKQKSAPDFPAEQKAQPEVITHFSSWT